MKDLFIIDGIGAFFTGYKRNVINWSKIPFDHLEKRRRLKKKLLKRILENFEKFLRHACSFGYNAVSLDDVAHLASFDIYPEELLSKISHYRSFFGKVIKLCHSYKLKVFLTTDVMFFNEQIRRYTRMRLPEIIGFLGMACRQVFETFKIDGVIARIGERDGNDVEGEFLSDLCIRTPKEANRLIKGLLPLFEQKKKLLIFRTWTVGAHAIGDLMWNAATYDRTFKGIVSRNFIVSMKYGDTDFFSKLSLNPLLFHGEQQKLLELQTRREREGFGLFPNYLGWEWQEYQEMLKSCQSLRGISVWCQSGGWSRNRDLTFIRQSSRWVELNTLLAIRLFKDEYSADQVIEEFFGTKDKEHWKTFLMDFRSLFCDLLYPQPFDRLSIYFRRLRIPPLLWMTWNFISLTPFLFGLFKAYKVVPPVMMTEKLKNMEKEGESLSVKDWGLAMAVLRCMYASRLVLAGLMDYETAALKFDKFRKKWKNSPYKFQIDKGIAKPDSLASLFFRTFVRHKSTYRLLDLFLLHPLVSRMLLNMTMFFMGSHLPKVTDRKAMSFDTLFK